MFSCAIEQGQLSYASSVRCCEQLDLLEAYLIRHNIPYQRNDQNRIIDPEKGIIQLDRHRILVEDPVTHEYKWDAICQECSYGYPNLLEIMGELVEEGAGDGVVGWLTAAEVVERIEKRKIQEG